MALVTSWWGSLSMQAMFCLVLKQDSQHQEFGKGRREKEKREKKTFPAILLIMIILRPVLAMYYYHD